jgi:hypothetical protein
MRVPAIVHMGLLSGEMFELSNGDDVAVLQHLGGTAAALAASGP